MGRLEDVTGLDRYGLPVRPGVYIATGIRGSKAPDTIQVYRHPGKGLCCLANNFRKNSKKRGMDNYIPIKDTGLHFLRIVDPKEEGIHALSREI